MIKFQKPNDMELYLM